MLRVDAHHHLWHYNAAEYNWLEGPLADLRRDFLLQDLLREARSAEVSGTVAVQARQSLQETDWLLEVAAATPLILGVVGWLPLRDLHFPALLERYGQNTLMKGLRHVLQAEADGFMLSPAFQAGITRMQDSGLVYDLLIVERQLQEATRLVDCHPHQVFVLDHIAKPRIAANELQPWSRNIREIARRPNVLCKISGMVTEADPHHWSADELKPYFETVLEAFTPARLMAGTDWPVLLAGCTYEQWWSVLSEWTAALSHAEQAEILGGTAVRTYKLTLPVDTRSTVEGVAK